MKKLVAIAVLTSALSVTAMPTYAGGFFKKHPPKIVKIIKYKKKHHKVPEIDAALAPLAFAFIGGFVALRRGRQRQLEELLPAQA